MMYVAIKALFLLKNHIEISSLRIPSKTSDESVLGRQNLASTRMQATQAVDTVSGNINIYFVMF